MRKPTSNELLPHLLSYGEAKPVEALNLMACTLPEEFDAFEAKAKEAKDMESFALSKLVRLVRPTQRRWLFTTVTARLSASIGSLGPSSP